MKMTRYKTIAYEVEIPRKLDEFKDWEFSSGATTGDDFRVFARLFRKEVTRQLPEHARLVEYDVGHYYVSGFVKRDGNYAYFSIPDVRYFPGEWYSNILIRTAKSDKDYTGGSNGYTTLEKFGEEVLHLLNSQVGKA